MGRIIGVALESLDEIFSGSFSRSLGNTSYNKDFIDSFYSRFISQSDEIAELFKDTNMSAQKTMLHDSLNLMVDYYKTHALPPGLKKIAEVHKDIPGNMFDLWIESLLQTVQEFDPQYEDQIATAWREVLKPGMDLMRA